MSDVSITDLIAEARWMALTSSTPKHIRAMLTQLAAALEVAERDAQTAEDQANNLAGDVVQLEQKLAESVTVPTENARERLAKVIMEADSKTIDYDRKWPLALNADGRDNFFAEQWKSYLPHADAVLARFRLPVPVEPETQIEKRAEYKLVWGDGGERVSGDVEYFTRRMSADHGDKLFEREITTTTSDWEEIKEGGTQ
jgi:hypothetical protein